MKVVNIFGGPGTGKSTAAAGLFYFMKLKSYEVELVQEYAKYLVWAERVNMFKDQAYIFAKQNNKLDILQGKVDWCITDSPLLMGLAYMPKDYSKAFEMFVVEQFEKYENVNIFLQKTHHSYNENGRNQTELEANALSERIKGILTYHEVPFTTISTDENALPKLFKTVTGENLNLSELIVT